MIGKPRQNQQIKNQPLQNKREVRGTYLVTGTDACNPPMLSECHGIQFEGSQDCHPTTSTPHPTNEIQNSNQKRIEAPQPELYTWDSKGNPNDSNRCATGKMDRKEDRNSLACLVFAPWEWRTTCNLPPTAEQTRQGWFLIHGSVLTMVLVWVDLRWSSLLLGPRRW